jgi:hypothetical protein
MSRSRPRIVDPEAPHGRDSDGVPLAPYGLKTDGTPRLSNRGAKAGQRGNGNTGPSLPTTPIGMSKDDKRRRASLLGLLETFVTMPLVGLGMNPLIERRIGERQAMALAGDAVIINAYSEPVADSLIVLAQSKPAILSWLDTLDDKAPWLQLLHVGIQIGKAVVGNHLNPSREMAQAAVHMANMRAIQIANEINQAAEEMGIPTSIPEMATA